MGTHDITRSADSQDSPLAPKGAAAPGSHSDGFWHPEQEVWILGLWHLQRCAPNLSLETRICLPGYSQTKCSADEKGAIRHPDWDQAVDVEDSAGTWQVWQGSPKSHPQSAPQRPTKGG